jgi:hypothetical protein
MTGRARLGDFLGRARVQLDPTALAAESPVVSWDAPDVGESLARLVTTMSRHVGDITTGYGDLPAGRRSVLTGWGRAGAEAREALANAAAFLASHKAAARPPGTRRSGLACRLDAAAAAITAGRDLLQAHFTLGPGGVREPRTEWAPVIGSQAVGHALLAEMADLARRAAPQAAAVALSPGLDGSGGELKHRLNGACQWLWIAHASVAAALPGEPVRAEDGELLAAIPSPALPARRQPRSSDRVPAIYEGITDCAERARRAGWAAAWQPAWSPGLSAASLRRTAAAGVAASYHCDLVLRAFASRPGRHSPPELSKTLGDAAVAAGQARGAWLASARELASIATDTRSVVTPAAAEAEDLAWWTGRLAYADPDWTPARGPATDPRTPKSLAPNLSDVRQAAAAVHHAADTLTMLARANLEQVRTAGQAERILVPTRSLPDSYDIPHPVARAPRDRLTQTQAACRDAARAADGATTAIADIAEATGAPSRYLAAARAAATGSLDRPLERDRQPAEPRNHEVTRDKGVLAGPLERSLHNLGITSSALLGRATDLDRAGERLLLDAAAQPEAQQLRPGAAATTRSEGIAEAVSHALACGDPRAKSLLPFVPTPTNPEQLGQLPICRVPSGEKSREAAE